MTLTDKLSAIQKRADGATPGPWIPRVSEGGHCVSIDTARPPCDHARLVALCNRRTGLNNAESDSSFIAAARTDVPALCAALRIVLELIENHPSGWDEALRPRIASALAAVEQALS